MSRAHLLLSVLLLSTVVEGLDFQLLSLVGPLILSDLGITRMAFGSALSSGLIGLAVGAVAGGWLGDRTGPKPMLIGAAILFSTTTALMALVHTVSAVVVLRALAGFAIGAAGPNAIAVIVAWLPVELRAKAITAQTIGVPAGGMIGAVLLGAILPILGWRGCFVWFGCLSLFIAVAMASVLPAGRYGRPPAAATLAAPAEQRPVTGRFLAGIWLVLLCSSYVAYAAISWLPVMVTQRGQPLSLGLRAILVFNLLALIVAVAGGFLMSSVGSRRLMQYAALATTAGCAGLLWLLGPFAEAREMNGTGLQLAAAAVGGGCAMLIAVNYVVLAQGFPIGRRATGVGIGTLVGRVGGITSSYFGAMLLGQSARQSAPFFLALFVAIGGIFLAVSLIDRHIQAQPREIGA